MTEIHNAAAIGVVQAQVNLAGVNIDDTGRHVECPSVAVVLV